MVDQLHLAVLPILLGAGERRYDEFGALPDYEVTSIARCPATCTGTEA
ncbi:hypothetical protein AB4305_02615 [Nocardia sp. 2YAB30]